MTEDEIIAVVTAYKEGKKIQCKYKRPHQSWNKTDNPIWNFADLDYREKPEPREYWISTISRSAVNVEPADIKNYIHVIEVLDEEG